MVANSKRSPVNQAVTCWVTSSFLLNSFWLSSLELAFVTCVTSTHSHPHACTSGLPDCMPWTICLRTSEMHGKRESSLQLGQISLSTCLWDLSASTSKGARTSPSHLCSRKRKGECRRHAPEPGCNQRDLADLRGRDLGANEPKQEQRLRTGPATSVTSCHISNSYLGEACSMALAQKEAWCM